MRNCLHKCNRTQVRPATNEDAEGIVTVASLLPQLTEAVREGRTRHFDDITAKGDPDDDEETVMEGDVMDVRLGRPDTQPEPESNALTTHIAASLSCSVTHAEPEAEVATSLGIGFDFEKRPPIPRDTLRTHPRTVSRRRNRVGKCPDGQRSSSAVWISVPPRQVHPSPF